MKRDRIGQILFVGAAGAALALYGVTAPDGLPWNGWMHLALAYLGEIAPLPAMPHPVWGFHVQAFGGAVALASVLAAVAAGLLAALVNRYLGWRFAAAAAIAWIFLPSVWNRAVTGERSVVLASLAVAVLWGANALALLVTRKARKTRQAYDAQGLGGVTGTAQETKRGKINRIAGWTALGAALAFALASLTAHDYRLGEPASAYAKGVVEAAAGRIVVMNGLCDDQIQREAARGGAAAGLRTVAMRHDDAYRSNLVVEVRAAFPDETELHAAAQIGPESFVAAAMKRHPERFYRTDGHSTTPEAWARRWEAFKPYLGSSDPFVAAGRRMFAQEGNAVANALADSPDGGPDAAWRLYRRIYEEVDPGNFSALVNLSEMIRRGYAASADDRKAVREKMERFLRDAKNRTNLRGIAAAAGPVRADPALLERMAAETRKRIADKVAAGETAEVAPELLSLVEWSNEMVRLMNAGERKKAGRIARAILTNPKWRGFIPANAVLGSVAAEEGDYAASASFYRVATDTTNAVPVAVLNDYADTLLHLDRLDEAERMARRAVKESDETFWLARLTLAEVLEKKPDGGTEAAAFLKDALKHAPAKARERIRRERGGGFK